MDGARAVAVQAGLHGTSEGAEGITVPPQVLPKRESDSRSALRGARAKSRAPTSDPSRNATATPLAAVKSSKSTETRSDDTVQRNPHPENPRQQQNRVGKRYRDRLGAEFDNLHAALRMRDDDEGEPHRRRSHSLNKTKIVELARERVMMLVRDWEAVKAERDALLRERVVERW